MKVNRQGKALAFLSTQKVSAFFRNRRIFPKKTRLKIFLWKAICQIGKNYFYRVGAMTGVHAQVGVV
jgi:hypothetical protein